MTRNQDLIEKKLREIGRKGTEELLSKMNEYGFFNARCSGHDSYRGGTANHTLWTLFAALDAYNAYPEKYSSITTESIMIVCLLHDLGDMHNGFPEYHGHGRRSANILRSLNVELSKEELSAIRFHMGRKCHIVDDFDRELAQYRDCELAKLLRYADHTAAGVMNNIEYEGVKADALTNWIKYDNTVYFNDREKHWYLDTMSLTNEQFPTRNGDVMVSELQVGQGTTIFGLNMFHISSYDFVVLRNDKGNLGVFTVVSPTMGMGDIYRSDRGGFGYSKVVVYNNRFRSLKARHYAAVEHQDGKWSIISLTHTDYDDNRYHEFVERHLEIAEAESEAQALYEFRHKRHGIDVSNGLCFERIEVDGVHNSLDMCK